MMLPPGARLLHLARAWFDEGTVTRVFEPLIADWQREWADAQTASLARRGRILISGLSAFLRSLLTCSVSLVAMLPPARVGGGFLIGAIATTAMGATAIMYPEVRQLVSLEAPLMLLLGALAGFVSWLAMVLLPLGALPATMLARYAGASRADIVRLACLLILAIIVTVGWVGPYGERVRSRAHVELRLPPLVAQGMTEAQARQTLREPRLRSADLQMSLPALWQAWVAGATGQRWPARVLAELHRRVALVGLAVVMTVAGWRLASRRPRRPPLTVTLWWLSTAAILLGCWLVAVRASAGGTMVPGMTSWATLGLAVALSWLITRHSAARSDQQITR